ncbi:MAG: HAD family hydrolase [Clostridium fessum]
MGTRLIALDLDGTLLNEKMHVSEKTRQVMELCAQRGIEIVPATGRALPAVPEGGFEPAGRLLWHIYKWGGRPGFREKYLGVGKLPELGRDDPGD